MDEHCTAPEKYVTVPSMNLIVVPRLEYVTDLIFSDLKAMFVRPMIQPTVILTVRDVAGDLARIAPASRAPTKARIKVITTAVCLRVRGLPSSVGGLLGIIFLRLVFNLPYSVAACLSSSFFSSAWTRRRSSAMRATRALACP